MTDLTNITLLGHCSQSHVESWADQVVVHENFAYIVNGDFGLASYYIGNVTAPREVSNISTGGYAMDVDVWKNYLLMCDAADISIFDITNHTNPVLIEQYSVLEDPSQSHQSELTLSRLEERAFLTAWNCELRVINISDPCNIETLYLLEDYSPKEAVPDPEENFLFLTHCKEGLIGLDIQDLANPIKVYTITEDIEQAYRVCLDSE